MIMKTRQLVVLALLAGVSVAATAAVLRTGAPTVAADRRGEKVLPVLSTRPNDITALTVRQGADTFAIDRRDYQFVAADSGYPVKADAVRDLVASSAELMFEEARTRDPARYADLGLADPPAAKDSKAGDAAPSAGEAGAGKEVTFRAGSSGTVRLPFSRADWFVPLDLDVKRSEIKKIELAGGGRDGVEVNAEKPGELTLAAVPEKRVADTFKVSRLGTPVESFTFQDVRKATKPADDARRMIVDVEGGLRLVLTSVGDITDGWVQIAAQATDDAKQDAAKAIAAKVDGYDFRLPSSQAEILSWTNADLTNEQSAEISQPPALSPPPFTFPGAGGR
jgi:Domain of unknown function (DUF4340)